MELGLPNVLVVKPSLLLLPLLLLILHLCHRYDLLLLAPAPSIHTGLLLLLLLLYSTTTAAAGAATAAATATPTTTSSSSTAAAAATTTLYFHNCACAFVSWPLPIRPMPYHNSRLPRLPLLRRRPASTCYDYYDYYNSYNYCEYYDDYYFYDDEDLGLPRRGRGRQRLCEYARPASTARKRFTQATLRSSLLFPGPKDVMEANRVSHTRSYQSET